MEDMSEAMCDGFLFKSPPSGQMKSQRSWKRRYCVLVKMNEGKYQISYFESEEKTDKPLGVIDLSQVSLMFLKPETHSLWGWIRQTFRCPASCVLYLKVAGREYFLIGENSCEMDKWFSALFKAMRHRPHNLLDRKESGGIRDITDPLTAVDTEQRAGWQDEEADQSTAVDHIFSRSQM